ncbi:hypothetical protein D3218_07835 [Aureimonas flava]|uniref:DUF6456 domain-containing protein n=1 Tax=Aureimonas flava TaxID=2320271 RepID=A0A3A1WKH7_9HYPH|nr:DUF6456 domain-containing protein [Aureimonas flava]RIY01272.1 hypothetical protein D3218_07835 [Aureimonas flava]
MALDTESPLARLATRRGANGLPFLAAHEVAAGERLRADFTRGGLSPSVTQRWDDTPRTRGRAGPADLSDAVLDCRRRVELAMRAVGPELSGVLLDVCCFLKGTERVEAERQWPARSAKIVLKTGLAALARHYGLIHEAGGHGRGVRAWTGG